MLCWNCVSTTLTPNERGSWRAAGGVGSARGRVTVIGGTDDRYAGCAAGCGRCAHSAGSGSSDLEGNGAAERGTTGGLTSEAAIRMDWMLSESMGMRS